MKNKILVLTSTFPRWEKKTTPPFVYELSKRLTDSFHIYVLAPYSKGSKRKEQKDNMEIHRFKYWYGKNLLADGAILPNLKKNKFFWLQVPFFIISDFLVLRRMLKKYNPSIVHAHWIIPQGLIAVLAKKFSFWNGKIVCTSHGSDIHSLGFLKLKKWILNQCDTITVVSSYLKSKVLKLNLSKKIKLEVIPMGVDSSMFKPEKTDFSFKKNIKNKTPILLFVGRLSYEKGVYYLIKSMVDIKKKFPKAKLLIIGDGPLKKDLSLLIKNLKLNRNIELLGWGKYQDLPKNYLRADIFISPSIKEAFGLVFVEAMMSGCLTIGTDIPALDDIIKQNRTGYRVKVKSSKEISECVIKILKNDKNQDYIIKNALKFSKENFDWEIIKKKYEIILKF